MNSQKFKTVKEMNLNWDSLNETQFTALLGEVAEQYFMKFANAPDDIITMDNGHVQIQIEHLK